MILTKLSETSSTITLGWTPPAGVGGYVLYANGQVVSVATKNLRDGSLRNSIKFSKTSPGPPFQVAAVCRSSAGAFTVEAGTYSEGEPPPPPPPPGADWFPAGWLSGPASDATMRAALPPRKGALVGIWDSGHPGITRITQREGEVGRRLDIGAGSYYSGIPNSDGKMTAVKQGGRLPLVDAGHYGAASASEIVNGSKDSYIRQFVKAASAIGGPVFVRQFHEYAGPWMAPYYYDNARSRRCTAAEWKAMCQRPVDVARSEGIDNIVWIWCPTVYDDRAAVFGSYPGDSYVDIVGDDNYGYADVQWSCDKQAWMEHWEVHNGARRYPVGSGLRETCKMLHDAFPGKPFAVMETGRAPHSSDASKKPQWIRNIVADTPTYLERMVLHVYSDYGLEADPMGTWTLDAPPAALDAYRDFVNAPYFKTRSVPLAEAATEDLSEDIEPHPAPASLREESEYRKALE